MEDQGDQEVPIGTLGAAMSRMGSFLRIARLTVIVTTVLLSYWPHGASAQGGCELDQVGGGVDVAIDGSSGDLVVAAAGLRLYRSTDGGISYQDRWLGVEGSWPSVAFSDGVLYLAAGRWGTPNEVFILRSEDGGESFSQAVVVHSSVAHRIIDPEVLVEENGNMLLFLTEIVTDGGKPPSFTIRLFESTDGGDSWLQLSDVIAGPPNVKIEDPKATQTTSGDVLLAYEFELVDLGASRIEQLRSTDAGLTWEDPTIVWDDVPGSDDEPGGYQQIAPGEIWFLASTDEDVVEGYTEAVVKRKVSTDGGLTWHSKAVLISEYDQIVFGSGMGPSGDLAVATVRFYTTTPRTLAVYHLDPEVPGVWACRPLLFVDGWDGGSSERWSGRPATIIGGEDGGQPQRGDPDGASIAAEDP